MKYLILMAIGISQSVLADFGNFSGIEVHLPWENEVIYQPKTVVNYKCTKTNKVADSVLVCEELKELATLEDVQKAKVETVNEVVDLLTSKIKEDLLNDPEFLKLAAEKLKNLK